MRAQDAANIVQLLRADPLYYRNFGPFWWHVKRRLKAAGHTQKVLPHLGDFEDTSDLLEPFVEGLSEAKLDRKAFEAAEAQSAFAYNEPTFTDDYGETYTVFDPDAEG